MKNFSLSVNQRLSICVERKALVSSLRPRPAAGDGGFLIGNLCAGINAVAVRNAATLAVEKRRLASTSIRKTFAGKAPALSFANPVTGVFHSKNYDPNQQAPETFKQVPLVWHTLDRVKGMDIEVNPGEYTSNWRNHDRLPYKDLP